MCVKRSDSESTEIIFLISYKLLYIIYEISKSLEFAHPYLKGATKKRFMRIVIYNWLVDFPKSLVEWQNHGHASRAPSMEVNYF